MIPVQSQVTQSNSEEAKKLFGKYTLQGLLDELDRLLYAIHPIRMEISIYPNRIAL